MIFLAIRSHMRLKPPVACLILFICKGLFLTDISVGQATNDVDTELSVEQQKIAPVKVDGRVLFYVSGVASFTPDQRAASISKRIKKASADFTVSPDSVTIIKGEDHLKIYAGKEFIMNVYSLDAESQNISITMFAEIVKLRTSNAINLYRHDRSRPVLIRKSLFAVAGGAALIILLYVFMWLIRLINSSLQNRLKSSVDSLENKSYKLISSNQLWKVFNILFRAIKIIVLVVIFGAFIQYILGLFPWTNNIAVSIFKIFLNPIKIIWNGFITYLPSLIFLIIIGFITRYVLKLIRLLFRGVAQGAIVIKNFYPDWAMPTFKILRIFIIAFAVIIAYPYIPGSGSTAFKGVSIFLGVLASLGSSSFVGNVIAGYSMTYRRAFKIGDLIEVDIHLGFVEEQKLMVTRLRSVKNEEIVIPNSLLMNSHIINFSELADKNGLILHTTVGIGYETPWRQVDAMLKLAADRTEGFLKDPPPFVLKKSLGDFAVNYEINAYCKDVDRFLEYYTVLHQNILDIFNENNVQIMTPAYMADPQAPKVVAKDQWNIPLANERKS
jgi:small-conductance mechanosensitive channel